ncbi:GAF domain-containing protein [Desulfofundulus sp. TPOSR]|uniref:LytS/YhcK type 5TM receptor domain-containing protein n=1 Tax=Desulfofundulus sp. TPOSR TaxID=2714340 RepID=UPI00140BD2D8|nr:LytS/YhcK type 5TM receptor domain-containing protein [Desulfofundulus sp. TPOSR]NHM27592.1 GAF domain-containing protein [Desulfofundulus sp. TPOSR]
MTWSLALTLAYRLSMVATAAFILSRMPALGRILSRQLTPRDKLLLTLALGGMGIVGTYAAVPIHGALANSRVVGVMVAGLLGGPLVGAGAGLIAGIHRYLLGGFTAFSCALAAVAEGALGGLVQHYYRRGPIPWHVALLAGLAGETLQMAIILATARPFGEAWALVQIIGPPMIIVNSIGVAIFMVIVKTAAEQRERIAACQAQQALRIATQTLPFLRHGLNRESAEQTARIIYNSVKLAAVAITNGQEILAHVGRGDDHHHPGTPILTSATLKALATGEVQVAQTRDEIGCQEKNCRLASAVVVPLKRREVTIGTLKLYHDRAEAVERVAGLLQAKRHRIKKLPVEKNGEIRLLDYQDIIFGRAKDGSVQIVTASDTCTYTGSMTELEARLNSEGFLRVHKSFLVNLNQVQGVLPWFKGTYWLVMGDPKKTQIPVSKSQLKELKSILGLEAS